MTVRKRFISAAFAALACCSAAFAADGQQTPAPAPAAQSDLSLVPTYMDATSGPTSLTPLMYELSNTSFGKWMIDNKLDITGFVEGGYWYDTSNPRLGTQPKGNYPTNVGFPGAFSNRGQLDQADISFSKTIDTSKKWDFGFMVEMGYGTDDSQIHSSGLLDNNGPVDPNSSWDPKNQFDIVQANASVLLPIGNGVTVEMGKFVTPLGVETISPLNNAFYTHSYIFSFGIPLTQTGVMTSYTFPKLINGNDMTVSAGVTRGWNQSLRDNNGAVDFLGGATAALTSDQKLSLTLNISEGPQGNGDNSDYWTVVELIPTYKWSDQLSSSWDILYGDFPNGAATPGGNSAQWYGVASYTSYKVNSYVTLNLRDEIYRDQGGFTNSGNQTITSGGGAPLMNGAVNATYDEITFGAQLKPLPNDNIFQYLVFRPEVRFDYSDRPVFNHAHNSTNQAPAGDYDQFSVGMDAIMQF
jgi:hypothetical protein